MAAGSHENSNLHHHGRRMAGRDPHEAQRAATPLELLFDLTFVASFNVAASELAHAYAAGHIGAGLIGFGIASFAICWAWTNFSWFASAFDTDDWPFRVATMVQMTGVLLLALGLPRMFAALEHGQHLDAGMMVAGYVIMRVAVVFQWLRAAVQNPPRRGAALTYAAFVFVAQIGWVALAGAHLQLMPSLAILCALALVEVAAPVIAERIASTPWHAHHIAERYSLFAIIALGEGVLGTVAALTAVTARGWTLDAALVCAAGVGLTFGIWWVYDFVPSAALLHADRKRAFAWSYGQLAMIIAIVASAGGLHVAAYFIADQAHVGPLLTILSVAVPVSVFLGAVHAVCAYFAGRFDRLQFWLIAATALVIAGSIYAATLGVQMAFCLAVLTLAPVVTIVGYETRGHLHKARTLRPQA